MKSFFLLFCLVTSIALADKATQFETVSRYSISPVHHSVWDAAFGLNFAWSETWMLSVAQRLAIDGGDIGQFDYKLEGTYSPLSFVYLTSRVWHAFHAHDTTSQTTLLAKIRFDTATFSWLRLSLDLGMYWRYLRLLNATAYPSIWGESFRDRDFVAAVGIAIIPTETWRVDFSASTFEMLSVFNLNHPFLESRVSHPIGAWLTDVFARYQMGLGFGRPDQLVIGAGFRTPM